jgi:hypothetical protein
MRRGDLAATANNHGTGQGQRERHAAQPLGLERPAPIPGSDLWPARDHRDGVDGHRDLDRDGLFGVGGTDDGSWGRARTSTPW